MEGIFEILERNGFHQPENPFPLARMKNFFKTTFSLDDKKTCINVQYLHKSLAEMSEKQIKKSVSTSQKITFHWIALKNTFPLDGKILLAVGGVYQNGRKNGFHQPENQLPLGGIRLFFRNQIFRLPQTEQKPLNEIILF